MPKLSEINDIISVVDFGGQYTHLIAEGLKERGYYAAVVPAERPYSHLSFSKGFVLSGGPKSVYDSDAPECDSSIFEGKSPVLGICYGGQLMVKKLGGKVEAGKVREYGKSELVLNSNRSRLFEGLSERETVWMSHGDIISDSGDNFEVIGYSENGLIAALKSKGRELYAVQFHPEVNHTPRGLDILENFAKICGCRKEYTDKHDIENAIENIRAEVGTANAGALTSFGVDSTVAATLLNRAYPGRAVMVYISGLDRKGDRERAERLAEQLGFRNFVAVDAQERFIEDLKGERNPEIQRIKIGDRYVLEFDNAIRARGWDPNTAKLVQGTLYTDRIESGEGVGKKAHKIKSHHNIESELIKEKRKRGLVVEPNEWKYKDGVRKRAIALGLPEEIINAEPFPGPGLAVRIMDDVQLPEDPERVYEEANKIAGNYGLHAYILPVRTVGVMGDYRAYLNLAVTTGNPDFSARRAAAVDIVNNVKEIGRVAYSFADALDQEALLHIKPLEITEETLEFLRETESVVRKKVADYGIKPSQMPVILVPGPDKPWIAIRPILTQKYMTAQPGETPIDLFQGLARDLISSGQIANFLSDDTDKPPATVEWK